jgi:membrane protease YdiL (CAAX protease family)
MTPALKSALPRIGFFAAIAFVTFIVSSTLLLWILPENALLVAAVFSNFASASIANAISLRTFERGRLADVGLGWTAASRRNLSLGLLGGIGAAMAVLLLPVVVRVADLVPAPHEHFAWPSLLFLSLLLAFGAIGEELLFRGYGFQVFLAAVGPFAAILPAAVLFAFMHANNPAFGFLAGFNTFLWGVLLGYSFLRSGDLWLPIGLHFGWNWTMPLLGVNLSGLTMGVTGYTMRWKIGGLWSGGAYGIEGGLLTTAIVIVLYYYLEKAPIQPQEPYLLYKDRA